MPGLRSWLAAAAVGAVTVLGGRTGLHAEPGGATLDAVPLVTLDAVPLGVPLDSLSPPARSLAADVLGRTVFAQRVTGLTFPSREPVFRFLLEHPDLAAGVARALDLGEYRVTVLDDGYVGDDHRGARGVIRVLDAGSGHRLFHLQGTYEHRGLPTLAGQLLVLLEFRHVADGPNRTRAEVTITGHLALDTPLLGPLARVVAALTRPLVEQAVERKVRRFFRTVARVSRWAHDQPEILWAGIEDHPQVEPGPVLTALRELLVGERPPPWSDRGLSLWPAPGERPGSEPATVR